MKMRAIQKKRPDTLCVKYSETVTFLTPDSSFQPFIFRRRHAPGVAVEFSPVFSRSAPVLPSDSLVFVVIDFNHPSIDRFRENDSLWIATDATYTGDTVVPPNYQRNAANSRRAVSFGSNDRPHRRASLSYLAGNELFRIRAQFSGRAALTTYSLAGRLISKSSASVQENQWISLRLTGNKNRMFIARGTHLYRFSFGDIQKQGIIHTQRTGHLNIRVED